MPSEREVDKLISDLVAQLNTGTPRYLLHGFPASQDPGDFAAEALVKIGPKATPKLIDALKSLDPWTRTHAAECLQELQDKSAYARLVQAAENESDTGIKAILVRGLGSLAEPAAFEILAAYAGSEDPSIRRSALAALGDLKDARAVPILTANLANKVKNARSQEEALDPTATVGLAQIGRLGFEAIRAMIEGRDAEAREAAISAIYLIDDPAILPYQLKLLEKPSLFRYTPRSLSSRKEPEFRAVFLRLVASSDWDAKGLASSVLRGTADAACESAIVRAILETAKARAADEGPLTRQLQLGILRDLSLAYDSMPDKPSIRYVRQAFKELASRADYEWCIGPLTRLFSPVHLVGLEDEIVRLALTNEDQDTLSWDSGQSAALRACAKVGNPAMKRLAEAWRKGTLSSNLYGDALAETSDPECIPLFEEALRHEDQGLHKGALWGLGGMAGAESDRLLLQVLSLPELAETAAIQLVRKGHTRGLLFFRSHELKTHFMADAEVKEGFAKMPVESLVQACQSPQPLVRYYASQALASKNNPSGIKTLAALCTDGPEAIAEKAIKALGQRDPPALLKAFRRPEIKIRCAAYFALRD